ncbi:MAG: GNAT family N-acetyltransferase [Ilumatobacteraceae bacterium]
MERTVRPAAPSDLPALVELAAEYCAAAGHEFDEMTVRAGFAPLLTDDRHGIVFVAEVDGRVDAYGVVTWGWSIEVGGPDVVLDELYVRTKGVGTGTLLVRALEHECRRRDVKRIFLETELPNEAARRLYAREGFEADTSIWMSKELR